MAPMAAMARRFSSGRLMSGEHVGDFADLVVVLELLVRLDVLQVAAQRQHLVGGLGVGLGQGQERLRYAAVLGPIVGPG